ncbi:hypothetical protein SCHPADRAFT_886144 [Schizopora paradoxa]|uniref:Uncharacterized protein n=1 Tax=Schizopora paradoxa TaxID=27342 RepID=A0A0H2S2W0_9AGAM|nr:hypothetical protein SCHPADRAFT_886144 [Schizopora paradoxa]
MTHTFPVKHSRQHSVRPPPHCLSRRPALTAPPKMPQRTLPARLLSPIRIPDGLSRPSPSPYQTAARTPQPLPSVRQYPPPLARRLLASTPAPLQEARVLHPSPYEPSSPWDLADLPIPIADCCERPAEKRHSGGPGPIRSRKSTARLRCVPFPALESPSAPTPPPLSAVPELSPSKTFDDDDAIEDDAELFSPFLEVPTHIRTRTWSGSSEDSEPPRTPPPRAAVLPALVDFRNLMPVSPSDEDEDASSKCTQEDWSL